MAATAPVATAFPNFSSLAAELRNQIWHEALPEEVDPALVPYRKGYWEDFQSETEAGMRFCYERLEVARCDFGMALVNREAHSIAKAWFRQQKRFDIRLGQGQDPMLVRPMDPATDALYVDSRLFEDFVSDINEYDLVDPGFDCITKPFPRVACPESFLRSNIEEVPQWVAYSGDWTELLVVVDASPSLPPEKDDDEDDEDDDDKRAAWPQWGFVDTGGDAVIYNKPQNKFVLSSGHDHVGDEVVTRILTSLEMRNGFPLDFTIRPVLATQTDPQAR